jgi:CRP/FNR family transcriptional regulator
MGHKLGSRIMRQAAIATLASTQSVLAGRGNGKEAVGHGGSPAVVPGEDTFAAAGTIVTRNSKQCVFWEGDPADYVYKVIRGTVCLYKLLPDGRRQVARFCGPGDLIGMGQFEAYPYTADAVTPTTVMRIRRSELETQLDTDPGMRASVMAAVSDELRCAQEQLLLLGRMSALERVASFLNAMSEQLLRQGADACIVDLPMTRVDIADYLGLTHETVCRAFSQLKADGIVDIHDHHRVEIRHPEVLAEIATGEGCERVCA